MKREINLVGGFYASKTLPWSAQDTVNWIPVKSEVGGVRAPYKLRGVPGLVPLWTLPDEVLLFRFITSRPYPIEAIESMQMAGGLTAGSLRLLPVFTAPAEAMDMAGALTGGELRLLLRTTVMQPEGMDMAGAITTGELRTLLRTTVMQPEGMDMAGALTGGELRALLINYTNYPPEGLDMAGAITGGSLT